MTFIKKINSENSAISNFLFVICIILLGVFLRIQYLQKSDFVINDGGMFYTMILDLQKNNYILPKFTSYNFSQIPYAYPPLSFYCGAVLNQFFHIDLITIFRLYPLFFNILSIPAFYFLAKEITQNNRQALLASAFYAILLPSFEWLISGGGLTRSPAHTLFIIALWLYLAYLRTRRWKYLIFSILSASLMTLHHIEYCWVLVFSMILFSLYSLKFKDCVKTGSIYLAGVTLLTSPYWGTVIAYHGLSPFISAFSTGDFSLTTSLGRLILMVFTRESLINYINVLSIIGLLFYLFSGKYKLVFWLVLIIFLDPRSAERLLIFPVTIFASFSIDQVFKPALENISQRNDASGNLSTEKKCFQFNGKLNYSLIFIGFSILYPFFLGFMHTFDNIPSLSMVTAPQREAMAWVKSNTPVESNFVVMESNKTWSVNKVSEWFPALAERKSLTTVQGTEWLPDSGHQKIKTWAAEAIECSQSGESCLSTWSEKNHLHVGYLFISKQEDLSTCEECQLFEIDSIKSSQKYQLIYENEGAAIFKSN